MILVEGTEDNGLARVGTRDPVAQRILAVLEACAASRRPVTVTQIMGRTGLAKTTVHRMCWKLASLGLLEHADEGFLIGTKLVALANANAAVREIRTAAMPHLVELQAFTGASTLTILADGKALVVDGLYSKSFQLTPRTGCALPLHLTAAGKAILAGLDPAEREGLLQGPLMAATPRSIVHPEMLERHLARIADRGVSVALEELQSGLIGVASAFRTPGGLHAAIGSVGLATNRAVLNSTRQVAAAAAQLRRVLAERAARFAH